MLYYLDPCNWAEMFCSIFAGDNVKGNYAQIADMHAPEKNR